MASLTGLTSSRRTERELAQIWYGVSIALQGFKHTWVRDMTKASKAAKEAFYEGHTGSSIFEVNEITLIVLAGHFLHQSLGKTTLLSSTALKFAWSFACYALAPLLATTLYSTQQPILLAIFLLPAFAIQLWLPKQQTSRSNPSSESTSKIDVDAPAKDLVKRKLPYLSVYRSTMMISTVIAILAVDFPVFPRRYAKAETWGTSMMDLGVGSFVFSSGLVSARSKYTLSRSLASTLPIFGLGIARIIVIRGVAYHEHITEYGRHWNFFITLALLPPLVPIARTIKRLISAYIVQGLLIAGGYQIALSKLGLQHWVLAAERNNIISANKEGLASFCGYASIFVLGMDAGDTILSVKRRQTVMLLAINTVIYLSAYVFVTQILTTSRRLANLPYILWVCAHNTFFLAALAWTDKFSDTCSSLLDATNRQGLWVFLAANMVTGLVNLVMGDSMIVTGRKESMAILVSYIFAVCVLTCTADSIRTRDKKTVGLKR